MYRDLKQNFWWHGMKKDIANYVNKCLTCQQVKVEHQKPAGQLQLIHIPEWKWEEIAMDFIVGMPKTTNGYDAIWVIIDRLTKTAHFLPVKMTFSMDKLAELYQATIGMAPYEALYGRALSFSIHWHEGWSPSIPKVDLVQEAMEKVKLIKERIRTAQSRQKSYADKRRKDLEFEAGDEVFRTLAHKRD
ncbi:hypothetical protein DH2020_013254 [Rehmannia glutinosa]|uniref:Integrase zinc-binding domain-containing protein n=1 Tax=Rehmannia glutinosa TaxID=99300 RepID=A0ABR0X5J6_REHGL